MTQKEFDSLCPVTKLSVSGTTCYGVVTKVTSKNQRTVYIKWNNISSELIYNLPLFADYELQYPNNSVGLEEII